MARRSRRQRSTRRSRRPRENAEDFLVGPIRGELLGSERLAERARVLAREQETMRERRKQGFRGRPARLLTRLEQTRQLLEDAHERLAAAAVSGTDVGPAGAWYRRAYFDDGSPLGSASAEECRIDSIAQSWSVISGAGAPERQAQALRALEEHLVDREARLIRLLTPAFDKSPRDPGYIKGYVPGVRENGAQYTHAALWAVRAAAMRGDSERAFDWFQLLNPFTHTDTAEGVATYRVEPYVVAADVYTIPLRDDGQRHTVRIVARG